MFTIIMYLKPFFYQAVEQGSHSTLQTDIDTNAPNNIRTLVIVARNILLDFAYDLLVDDCLELASKEDWSVLCPLQQIHNQS